MTGTPRRCSGEGSSFLYTYDFGNRWHHDIVVEEVVSTPGEATVPACIDGRRACPPEDCGGPWRYEDLLGVLANPFRPDRREYLEWIHRRFDPEAFDPADFPSNLRKICGTRLED